MKAQLIRAVNSRVGSLALSLIDALNPYGPKILRVLTYHMIGRPDYFADQMDYLSKHYNVISMQDAIDACNHGKSLPPRAVLITFDDAYRNFKEHAWPVLKNHGLPVTLFVPTAFPDQPDKIFWWDHVEHAISTTSRRDVWQTPLGEFSLETQEDRLRVFTVLRNYLKTLPHLDMLTLVNRIGDELNVSPPEHNILSWDELRALAQDGVTLGAHTQTHPLLNRVSLEEALRETWDSIADLRAKIGPNVLPVFAYPGGQFTDEVVDALRESEMALAFTTIRGANYMRKLDVMRIRRINIGTNASLPVMRARLIHSTPYLNILRPLSKPVY